ncbi:MAG TPA: hypothetical protein PK765_04430 [bacterium]|nr:hypothetical protein [bacterium]
MDGTNAGTFFPDSANNGKMITAYGDAKMSAGQSKFGGVSASFDGSN